MGEDDTSAPQQSQPDESPAGDLFATPAHLAEEDALHRAADAWAAVMAERSRTIDVAGHHVSAGQTATAPDQEIRRLPTPVSIGRVLVPLDGAAYAERALPYAAALLSTAGTGITLAHVSAHTAPYTVAHLTSMIRGGNHGRPANTATDMPAYLGALRTWMLQYVPDVDIEQINAPTALAGLVALQRQRRITITVLASHTRQGAERLILGSLADDLVREGASLTLVVPPLVTIPVDSMPLLTRLLVPLDGSVAAEQALGPVIGWLRDNAVSELAPRHVMLLTVATTTEALRPAEQYVQRVREVVAPVIPGVEISAHARFGAPATEIAAAATGGLVSPAGASARPDLIIMATHGRGGVGRWLYGSVASQVLPRAVVPVLLTHPPRSAH
jgi:nucleotide-binding universal stress UspA family protein